MAIASKKKTPRGTGKTRAQPERQAAAKARPGARKSNARRSASAPGAGRKKAPAGKTAARKTIVEPERSAPQMAEVDADVLEFIAAIDDFKQQHGRPFPSWSEVLLIVRQLGYRRS